MRSTAAPSGPSVQSAVSAPSAAAAAPALAAALLALAAPPAQAAWGMPDPLTERGQVVGGIYDTVVWLGVVVFVVVFALLVVVLWRFRETTGHGRATHERERHNIKAELAWFLIPLAIVLYIGGIAYAGLVELDHGIAAEDVDPAHHVRIEASQWNWAAKYPGGVTVLANPNPETGAVADGSAFVMPADTPILFNVTATDVIHAFQVLDSNMAFVIFIDANPLGANKYNLQTASFPAGEYFVQCNKMCLNPGHAYMRARIKAVPQADYDLWINEKRAAAGGSIVQSLPLQLKDGHVVGADGQPVAPSTVVAGTTVVVRLPQPSQDVAFTIAGVGPANQPAQEARKTIRAGERADPFFGFTLGRPGNYTLRASTGDAITFNAVQARQVEVKLDSFKLVPSHIDLEAGKTYLVSIPNVSNTVHDLFIGHFDASKPNSGALWASPAVGGGGTASFIVRPDQTGTFEMWCNQPGHRGLGMTGEAVVA